MKKWIVVLGMLWVQVGVSDSRVVQVSKNRLELVVSQESSRLWTVGQVGCLRGGVGRTEICGTVVKVNSRGALLKLSQPAVTLKEGEPVFLRGDEGSAFSPTNPSSHQHRIMVGAGAGVNLGTISGTGAGLAGQNYQVGLLGGVTAELPLGEGSYSVEAGLNFAQKGFSNPSSSVSFNYLEVPVLFKARLSNSGNWIPVVFVGPYVGYLVNASSTINSVSSDVSKNYKSLDWGVLGKLGLLYRGYASFQLGMTAGYGFGFADIDVSTLSSTHVRSIPILFHFFYPF